MGRPIARHRLEAVSVCLGIRGRPALGNQERNRPRPKYPRTNSTSKTTMMIPIGPIRLSLQEWYPEAGRMERVDGGSARS